VVVCPTRHKICPFGDISSSQSLALVWKKTKPNTTKAHIHQSKEMHCNTKKLKPGLVASYDIQPGNGAGLFSKKKVGKEGDKEKVKNKSLKGQGKHMTNKQAAIYIYIYIYRSTESKSRIKGILCPGIRTDAAM